MSVILFRGGTNSAVLKLNSATLYQHRQASHATTASQSSHGHTAAHPSGSVVLDNRLPPPPLDHDRMRMYPRIGNREIVGYGIKGKPDYFDLAMFPCPGVRWQADTTEIKQLKDKEKGDCHKLSFDEKKRLYRASFRQTFEEFSAPTGIWKWAFGMAMIVFGGGSLVYDGWRRLLYTFELPDSFGDEKLKKQMEYHIAARQGPMTGLASEWDYEVGTWKKNVAAKKGKSD